MGTQAGEERQMANRFASYADAVAAAAFVNALAFFVAVADVEVRCSLVHQRALVAFSAAALHGLYMLAIWSFRRGELRLRGADASSGELIERYRHRMHLARMGFVFVVGCATAFVSGWALGDGTCS